MASALLVGLLIAFVAYQVVQWITPTSDAKAAPIDVTRMSLTVVAGIGGVVALVVAYRRQRDLEQGRFVERFGAAAAQLGATDVAVRIAGVYAMAGVADESLKLRRQQCIDVLCGYLRLPYSPELGGNHQTKHVQKRTVTEAAGENEDHFEYRQNDREVRATIVRVIADHLRPEAEYSWSTSDFDFRTAHLEDVDFARTTFSGAARFDNTTFSGYALFREATFSSDARFDTATFSSDVLFDEATFSSDALFTEATFSGNARFRVTTFSSKARFYEATFSSDARFDTATFSSDVLFNKATFSSKAVFTEATFSSDALFDVTTFSSEAWFNRATFSSGGLFCKATFRGVTRFDKAIFSGITTFDKATFSDMTTFDKAIFSGITTFDKATFSGITTFDKATFSGITTFDKATFNLATSFHGVVKPGIVEPQDWPPVVAAS